MERRVQPGQPTDGFCPDRSNSGGLSVPPGGVKPLPIPEVQVQGADGDDPPARLQEMT
ncbi:hypothetical protein [Oscillatoria acuminata]|uniref:hypothetical protein n=1 Tax=Oscillatoria acuminata TaxID=118323 RepID=UPI0002E381B9|nr:hypothetical protein [Oscillatoria acuminata]